MKHIVFIPFFIDVALSGVPMVTFKTEKFGIP